MLTISSFNSLRRITLVIMPLMLSTTSLLHPLKRSTAYENLTAGASQQALEPITAEFHHLNLGIFSDYKRLRTLLIHLQAYQLFLLPIVLQIKFDSKKDDFVTSDIYGDNYILFRLVENIVYVDRAFYHLDEAPMQRRLAFFVACAYESIMILLSMLPSLTFSSPEEQRTIELLHTAYTPPDTYHTPDYDDYFPDTNCNLDDLERMLTVVKNNLTAIINTHPFLLDYPSLPFNFKHQITHAPLVLEDKLDEKKKVFKFQQTRWYQAALREKWLTHMLANPHIPPFNIDKFIEDFNVVRFQLNTSDFLSNLIERLTKRHGSTYSKRYTSKTLNTLFSQEHNLCHQTVLLSYYKGDTRIKLIIDKVPMERVPVY